MSDGAIVYLTIMFTGLICILFLGFDILGKKINIQNELIKEQIELCKNRLEK